MITTDQLEVLLRSVPQYFLFGAASLYIFAWIEKKHKYGIIADALLAIAGIASFIVLISGMIPPLSSEFVNTEHIKMLINMLVMLSGMGLLAIINLIIKRVKSKPSNPLSIIIFILTIFVFFGMTRLSKIDFQLNNDKQIEITE